MRVDSITPDEIPNTSYLNISRQTKFTQSRLFSEKKHKSLNVHNNISNFGLTKNLFNHFCRLEINQSLNKKTFSFFFKRQATFPKTDFTNTKFSRKFLMKK